ncbi:hypothetical protein KQI52_15550 [bacterium]|nr:hypothetical protein [bacterium]
MLSPKEAADRVWERYEQGQTENGDEWKFVCENCGGSHYKVIETNNMKERVTESIPCNCGEAKHAWKQESIHEFNDQKVYEPTDEEPNNLTLDYQESEDLGSNKVGEITDCHKCLSDFEDDGKLDEVREEIEQKTETKVLCADCGHESEIAWAQRSADSADLVIVETNMFDPHGLRPDPKFEEEWRARGWIESWQWS